MKIPLFPEDSSQSKKNTKVLTEIRSFIPLNFFILSLYYLHNNNINFVAVFMYQQKWVLPKQYVYLCSFLVLKWGIYWCPQEICALVWCLWAAGLVLSQRRLTSATWLALSHSGFNSALSPPRFGQKENHLSDTRPSRERNNSNLPQSSGHWVHTSLALLFYSELCSSFLLVAFKFVADVSVCQKSELCLSEVSWIEDMRSLFCFVLFWWELSF